MHCAAGFARVRGSLDRSGFVIMLLGTLLRPRLLAAVVALLSVSSAFADVFINEIHYDDSTASGDLGERIEVVAPSGTALTGYTLVLYNGNGGGGSYATLALGQPSQCQGYDIYSVDAPGLQNGAPDGIALVDGLGGVVQFLSYEGVFVASNGPAIGLSSTDIGVAESNATAPGTSLQLNGSGSAAAQFTWTASAVETFGTCNTAQTFVGGVDNPPTVTSTIPAGNASGVALNSDLQVNFSESVSVGANAFSLVCSISGGHSLAISGSGNRRTLNPDLDLALGDLCTATVLASAVTDQDGTPESMGADFVWSFSAVADSAPTLVASTPANGATGVAVNVAVEMIFSEPVTPIDPWFSLECNGIPFLGNLASANGGATWTFTAITNFIPNDVCTASITGSQVLDNDGSPQPIANNPTWAFSIAPDLAPTVASSFPADLAVNVPAASNLSVVFSEPVSVLAGGFVISCSKSGNHSFTESNSALSNYSLDPDIDFTTGENCNLDVIALKVTDIDGNPNQMLADVRIRFSIGAGLAGYYDRVDASSCRALRATLHGVIDNHIAYPYSGGGTDSWAILEAADQDPLDANRILDVYRNCSYAKVADRAGGTGGTAACIGTGGSSSGRQYNREHTWPNSHGFNDILTLDGFPNAPYTDTHMLLLSHVDYNADRGNSPYANCPQASGCTVDETMFYNGEGGGAVVYPGHHNWFNASSFETFDARKGDVARAQFYMAIRYDGGRNTVNGQREPDLELTDDRALITTTPSGSFVTTGFMGLLTDLLGWANADPVTTPEILRNDLVQSFQGNRNPFVDHPEWLAIAFPQPFPAACTGPALVAVDDDFTIPQGKPSTRAAPGALSDDHQFSAAPLPALSASAATTPAHGSVTLNADGSFSFSPDAGYCGKGSFGYTASDASGSDQGVVQLDISCAPSAVGSIADVTIGVGGLLAVNTAAAFADADSTLGYTLASVPALPTGNIGIDPLTGVIGGTPQAADIGVYTLTVTAAEPAPATATAQQSFTLTVQAQGSDLFMNGFE